MKDKTFTQEEIDQAKTKTRNNISYLNHVELICVDDTEPQNQPWLWPNVIPLDAFTIFAGVGGLGKSQLLMFIASAVSTGRPFDAGGLSHQLPQGAVIILSAEDSLKNSISPRLRALDADTKQIHVIKSVSDSRDPLKKRLMALDEDLRLLKNTIIELKEKKDQIVRLIIIDPIINFIGKTKDYINTEVSNFLYGITELAEEFNLSFILNKHLRKRDSQSVGSAMDEIAGSSAWGNSARQVWVICRDHEDKNKILFLDGKSNIKANMTGLAFNIKPAEILYKNNVPIKTSRIQWLDEVVTITPDEAVNEEKYEKSKKDKAIDFIIQHLKNNGQSVLKNIEEAALKAGIKERTFDNAVSFLRKDERIKITDGIYPNKCWQYIS